MMESGEIMSSSAPSSESSSVIPSEFILSLRALQLRLFHFAMLTEDTAEEYAHQPQNSNDHPLSALGRQVIVNENLTLTHNLADIKTLIGGAVEKAKSENMNIAGVYPIGQNQVFVNTEKNYCIPNTYVHELAHHFDFKRNLNYRMRLLLESMQGKLSRDEVTLILNKDELVAQAVADLVCRDHSVDASVITAISNFMVLRASTEATIQYLGGKLDERIYQTYTDLTDALRGASSQ